ncbi:VrrA/YqfQ family protein [Alteribacillus sp. HJP-4]
MNAPPQPPSPMSMSRFGPFPPSMPGAFPGAGFSGGGGIAGLMPQIQKMVGVAQTVTPMIRQYYPIVRQLPAIWKLLSASSALPALPKVPAVKESSWTEESIKEFDAEESFHEFSPGKLPPPKLYV